MRGMFIKIAISLLLNTLFGKFIYDPQNDLYSRDKRGNSEFVTWRWIYIFLCVFNDATLGTLFYDFQILFSLLHPFFDYVGLFFCNKLLFLMCHH